nr:hypothetical protein [Tanacetum cinerariifolium]
MSDQNQPPIAAPPLQDTGYHVEGQDKGIYPPQHGYPPQGYPPQGYPPPRYPSQGYAQGYPQQGYPPQGYPPPGYPQQGYPPPYYAPPPHHHKQDNSFMEGWFLNKRDELNWRFNLCLNYARAKFEVEKFDGSNDFGLWRVKMRCLLIQHGWEAALDPFPGTMTDADKIAALKTDFYKKVKVGHPNGTQALITKIGDFKINNEVTLYDVLVVPEYTVSLLSIHKLSRD